MSISCPFGLLGGPCEYGQPDSGRGDRGWFAVLQDLRNISGEEDELCLRIGILVYTRNYVNAVPYDAPLGSGGTTHVHVECNAKYVTSRSGRNREGAARPEDAYERKQRAKGKRSGVCGWMMTHKELVNGNREPGLSHDNRRVERRVQGTTCRSAGS